MFSAKFFKVVAGVAFPLISDNTRLFLESEREIERERARERESERARESERDRASESERERDIARARACAREREIERQREREQVFYCDVAGEESASESKRETTSYGPFEWCDVGAGGGLHRRVRHARAGAQGRISLPREEETT